MAVPERLKLYGECEKTVNNSHSKIMIHHFLSRVNRKEVKI